MGEIAVAKKDQKGELQNFLNSPDVLDGLKVVLPKILKPERIVKAVIVAATKTPLLYSCSKASIAQSLMQAAELGLDPSGTLGQGYLIPFYNNKGQCYEAKFISGYLGLVNLCRRSGELADIWAEVVYRDEFDSGRFVIEYGLERKLVHRPTMIYTVRDEKDIVGSYCCSLMKDGTKSFSWMTRAEIDGIRARSKAANSGPWVTDFPAMCKKTVIRRHCKLLPMSIETITQIEREEEAEYADPNIKSVASSVVDTLKPTVKPQTDPESQIDPATEPQPISSELPFPDPEPQALQQKKPEESKPTDDAGRRQELGRIIAEFVKPQEDNDGNRLVLVNNRESGEIEIENATEGVEEADLIAQSVAALSEFKGTNGWVNGAMSIDGLKGKRLEITLRKARDLFQKSTAA